MEFLKKHYEKVVLSVVLLLLAGSAAYLPIKVRSVIKDIDAVIPRTPPKQAEPLDITTNLAQITRARQAKPTRLAGSEHNLFNPVGWTKNKEGKLFKDPFYGKKGPNAVKIVDIKPLFLKIAYERLRKDSDGIRYAFSVVREAARRKKNRRKVTRIAQEKAENDIFILKEVKGDPLAPEAFVIELIGARKEIVVKADEPYSEVAGFKVGLAYPAGSKQFNDKRVGDKIKVDGRDYKIVVVEQNLVVLQDTQTTKQTLIQRG